MKPAETVMLTLMKVEAISLRPRDHFLLITNKQYSTKSSLLL